jgi:hypothetical protein
MMARRKVVFVTIPAQHSLEDRIRRLKLRDSVLAIIEKDRHLIEAALATDNRVASIDERVRQHLRTHAQNLPEVISICWSNPVVLDEECVAWLESGAPAERSRMLGYAKTESES